MTPMQTNLDKMMPTGMPGLDHLLHGGVIRGNSLLLEGPPGSGKSTFGVRMIYEGIVQYNEPGLIITFEEFPKQVYAESLAYGIDLAELERKGMMRVVWTPPVRILEGFTGKNDLIDKIVQEMGIKRIVIDSITHFKRVAHSEIELREVLAQIFNYLKLRNINAILVKELERMDDATIAFEEYLVDSSMRLYNAPSSYGGENIRYVEIRKTRGQGHISGKHPFAMKQDGIIVYPHLRPYDVKEAEWSNVTNEGRHSTGIDGLDNMMDSGFLPGTLNMLSGYSGTGKSILAGHFIDEGLNNDAPCLIISINETPEDIIRNMKSVGMDWQQDYDSGKLIIMHFHPVGLIVEEMLNEMLHVIRTHTPQRMILDSVDSLWSAIRDEDQLRDFVMVLGCMLEASGTTSLLLHESRDMGGSDDDSKDFAFIAKCVIQLSMAETEGELRRFVGIRKHAGSDHAKELRELVIDAEGAHVRNKVIGLSGILTGQTHGALSNVADEVIPSLEQITGALSDSLGNPDALPEPVRQKLTDARSQVGMLDVLLREHFGLTAFHKLADEDDPDAILDALLDATEPPAGS